MAIQKSERLVSLVMCLLAARRFVTKDQLRESIEAYRQCPSTAAFDRMFERDKADLRRMGIPVETGGNDPAHDDELGYRIRPDKYELPAISFEPDEAAVLGLAARIWQQETQSAAAADALRKLAAAGSEIEGAPLAGVEPRLAAGAAAFEPLLAALCERHAVTFGYRRPSAGEIQQRTVEPWGIDRWQGRWYVVGHDRDRDAPRVFRLDRIVGAVQPTGRSGSYTIPDGVDVRGRVTAFVVGDGSTGMARIRVRRGTGFPLRRRATSIVAEDGAWDVVEVPYTAVLESWLPEFGTDVVVLEPRDLRESVIRRLRAVAAAS